MMNTLLLLLSIISLLTIPSSTSSPCKKTCGSLDVKYPFGSGPGCGAPRFHPYISCAADASQLLLTTHKGTYPITSVNYETAVITVTPPCMSNCTSIQPSPVPFGLDWAGPFQLGPSAFLLLACSSSTPSITYRGNSICDPSSAYLCASFYSSCPAAPALGLPLFPPTNTCCVYSPANLDPEDELDLEEMGCKGYSSVTLLGDVPTDPARWEYGVALKYTMGGLDGYNVAPGCRGCELSGGVCGYAPPRNSFVCVCQYVNTTTDCNSYNWYYTSFASRSTARSWVGILAVLVMLI